MSPLRVLRGLIFGALGGLVGWLLIEFLPLPYPFRPARFEAPGSTVPLVSIVEQALLGLALGLAVGGFLGISEGLAEGTNSRFRRAFAWFLGLGAMGGFVGMYVGEEVFSLMGGKIDPATWNHGEFLWQVMARSLGWMPIGLFLGAVFGVPNFSFRRSWNGAVGGAIGGFLGGFIFDVLIITRLFGGPQVRMIGFTLIGAAIGFFINLLAEAMKRVWVKVLIGRNEGREYVIDTSVAYVGRDELADIPIFLDPMVPRRMASFRFTNGRYALHPESDNPPILVNGAPLVPGYVLRDGDAIQFGRVTLAFNEKASYTGGVRPVDTVVLANFETSPVAPGSVPIPMGPNVCEFCGQQRDPATGACACSVPGDAGPVGAPGYAPQPVGGYAPAGYTDPGYSDPGYGGAPAYGTAPSPFGGAAPSYGANAGPCLTAIEGPHAGQMFPIAGMDAGIGRDPAQPVALSSDSTASRRHARVYSTPAGWVLRDEGSANGTWVNGVRVQEQPLFPGDVIKVGNSQLRWDA